MKIELEGATCVITGRMITMTKAQAAARLETVGATLRTSVSAKTTFVVVTEMGTSAHTLAKAMGVPLLSEQEFAALLVHKSLEVAEPGEAGEKSVDTLLGEVRGVMQGVPSAEMWHALVGLLDECRAEDVHILTEYIDSYIARWTDDQMKGLLGSNHDASTHEWWHYRSDVEGELRVAPEHWVGQMQQGVDSPKFKIVRALDLTHAKMTSTAIIKILNHPHLAQLHILELPLRLVPSMSLIEALCAHPTLTHLKIGKVDDRTEAAFKKYGPKPGRLETLDICKLDAVYSSHVNESVQTSFSSPYFDSITSLYLSDLYYDSTVFQCMLDGSLFPNVNHVHFFSGSKLCSSIKKTLESPWAAKNLERLSARTLHYNARNEPQWIEIFQVDFAGRLDELDLSTFDDRGLRASDDPEGLMHMLERELPTAPLLESVDTLVLGQWKTDALCDTLTRHFPHLTIL